MLIELPSLSDISKRRRNNLFGSNADLGVGRFSIMHGSVLRLQHIQLDLRIAMSPSRNLVFSCSMLSFKTVAWCRPMALCLLKSIPNSDEDCTIKTGLVKVL
jgi:hypothetical protein